MAASSPQADTQAAAAHCGGMCQNTHSPASGLLHQRINNPALNSAQLFLSSCPRSRRLPRPAGAAAAVQVLRISPKNDHEVHAAPCRTMRAFNPFSINAILNFSCPHAALV